MFQRKELSKLDFCIRKAHRPALQKLRYAFMASIIMSSVGVVGSASAEEYVERSGNFAIPMPTPECDGVGDFFEDFADLIVDGVEYLGEKAIKTTLGLTTLLLEGNPDALIDEVNQTFTDAASAAATLSKYTPLALISVIVDVLPEGSVTTFLKKGAEFEESLRAAVASGIVSGLNPITLADTAINDLDEIGGDLLKVLVNLDDPLSAGNEFLKLNQKWNAAGALTYMFTEEDPITGMKKALNAMHRQIELVTTYAGPNSKVASALLGHSMEESKKFIDALPDGEDKKVAALFAATFAVTFKTQLSDPNFKFNNSVSRHPLYSAELRNVNTEWLGDDHNSGGKYDWGFRHPVVEDKWGCISLGDYAYPNRADPKRLNAICGVEEGRNVWWSRPTDYKLVWGDNCSGAKHDRSVWQPVCEEGYSSVGFVASGGSWEKPLPNKIACLKNDPDLLSVTSGKAAGLKWVATDEGSGAKYDGTFYNRNFLGMQLMHAVPKRLDPSNTEYQQWNVPVPVAGQAPSYDKAHCVNFYTEADYKGWTHEACDIDNINYLEGINRQMVQGGISSFQCGEEVAAVGLFFDNGGEGMVYCHAQGNKFLNALDNFGFTARTYSTYTTPEGKTILSAAAAKRKAADEAAAPVLFEFTIASTDVSGLGTGTVEVSQVPVSKVGGVYYSPGDTVTLSAVPTDRSEFHGWTGGAANCGTNLSCEITFASYVGINVQAIFKPKPTLTVSVFGGGKSNVNGIVDEMGRLKLVQQGGEVSLEPFGSECGYGDNFYCNYYSTGQQVNLYPIAYDGRAFDSWRGDDDCLDGSVTLTEDLRCEAWFKNTRFDLTVAQTPGVEITSEPSGAINCGTQNDCSESYDISDIEQKVTLSAKIDPDYIFVRWSGLSDCYDEDERDNDPLTTRVKVGIKNVQCEVIAVPEDTEYALTMEKMGGGTVTAEALPELATDGIDCSLNACSQLYPIFTQVKLTAIASRGSEFIGFTSADSGSQYYAKENDLCIGGEINMVANVSCVASFRTRILVVDGTHSSRSKEQNPYINTLGQQDLVTYDIWDVQNPSSGDNSSSAINVTRAEPVAEDLAKYGRVLWYTGNAKKNPDADWQIAAGPSVEAEGELAKYLDAGGCLLMSSPEYYKDRGLTSFMKNYLGVSEVIQDEGDKYVKGAGEGRFGFSELTIDARKGASSEGYFSSGSYYNDAFVHNSDLPGTDAIFTYRDSGADAAIATDNGIYRTLFFGFPFWDDQHSVTRAFMDFCGKPDSDDAYEVNDDIDMAVERSGLVALDHLRVMPANDDYFSWTSDEYADTVFSINFTHADGDLSLAVYDENTALIETSEGQEDGEQIIIDGVKKGERYYVRVYGANVKVTNTYALNISLTGGADFDNDGVADVDDALPEDPSEQFDNDGDLIGNNADPDDDNDGLPDAYELANGFDPLVSSDTFEDDADDDGYSDFSEYLADTDPNDASSTPPELTLAFFLVELDSDFDGVRDEDDNCPAVANADQLDTDSDQQGNVCDTDDDNDGLPDTYELTKGLNSLDAIDAALDKDSDSLSNYDEFRLGTDVNLADTDGDDINDNIDNNPLVFDEPAATLYSGQLTVLPDLNDDGIAEIGILKVVSQIGQVVLEVLNGQDQSLLNTVTWSDNYEDSSLTLHLIPDMNGNGFDEVGLFGIQDRVNNEGKPQVFVRDLQTGNKVGDVYNFVANWKEVSALVLDDMSGDGLAEIAIQGRFADANRPQLVVKVGNTNRILSTYSYPDLFVSPQYYQHSDINGDGVAEIVTFGRLSKNNKIQAKIASGLDAGNKMKAYNFPDKWDNISWHRLDDSNGDGQDDWGMFGTLREDGRPQLINKDGVSPAGALRIYAWPAEMQNAQFFRIPDMNNDGVDEVAAAGRRSNNGRYQFQVQDGTDRNVLLANHNLNLSLTDVTYHVLPDLSGDAKAEIGFMGINPDGEYELVIRHGDTVNGEFATLNLGSDWDEAPSITSLGDIDVDGLPDLLIYGQDATGEQLVITSL
jgi:hypothetical protein